MYRLRPDQLQLGFLKVLKGSIIENECGDYGIVYNTDPPYEVLHTNHISYDEILELKGISRMVDVYYNSGQFTYSLEYLEHFFDTPMKLYATLCGYTAKTDFMSCPIQEPGGMKSCWIFHRFDSWAAGMAKVRNAAKDWSCLRKSCCLIA